MGHQIKFEKGGSVETTTFAKVEAHQIIFEQGVRIKKMSAPKVCFLNIAVISFWGVCGKYCHERILFNVTPLQNRTYELKRDSVAGFKNQPRAKDF